MRLKNKVIIVTGSTTGIGKAIAYRCVSEGAQVMIHGLEKEWGDLIISELGKDKAVLQIVDLSRDGACERLVLKTLEAFGKLDAVVNNAAMVVSSNIHTTDLIYFR